MVKDKNQHCFKIIEIPMEDAVPLEEILASMIEWFEEVLNSAEKADLVDVSVMKEPDLL